GRLGLLRQRRQGARAVRRNGPDAALGVARARAARIGGADLKRSLAHPKELTYPCCLPALGELGEVSPREGPATRVQDSAGRPPRPTIRLIQAWMSEPSWVIRASSSS